jgi:Chitin binding Peritrophin-A domain
LTEPPQGNTTHCPRKNGIFRHPDVTICDIFYICVDGLHTEEKCMAPLVFDESTGTCTWTRVAGRTGCVDKKKVLTDGFTCPKVEKFDKNGQIIVHPQFEHPDDCTKFYVCINGVEPRKIGCENDDEVYNGETKLCDKPENVPGCEDWFDTDDAEEKA